MTLPDEGRFDRRLPRRRLLQAGGIAGIDAAIPAIEVNGRRLSPAQAQGVPLQMLTAPQAERLAA